MAISKTAKQAIRKTEINKIINDRRKKTMKETVKAVRGSIVKKDVATAEGGLSAAFKALDKAAKRGVIKKNQASRKKSRLSLAVAKAKK
jgi:small subunit ribosomal protein S20